MTAPRIVVAGEINADLVLGGISSFPGTGREVTAETFSLVLGSASAICASGLARLGSSVRFVGRVGDDLLGHFCLEEMAGAGIDVSFVTRDPSVPTGITVSLSVGGERALATCRGAMGAFSADDVPDDALDSAGHLHVSSFFLQTALRPGLAGLFQRARRRGLTTSLDPGHDPEEKWDGGLRGVLGGVDVFLPNETELLSVTGRTSVEEAVRSLGPVTVVAKLGARGALAWREPSLVRADVPARSLEVVDTTGAGDSFDAGFLHAWLRNEPLETCLRYGVAAGTLSTRALGGTSAQPAPADLEDFLRL